MNSEQKAVTGDKMATLKVISDCRVLRDVIEKFVRKHDYAEWFHFQLEHALNTPVDLGDFIDD